MADERDNVRWVNLVDNFEDGREDGERRGVGVVVLEGMVVEGVVVVEEEEEEEPAGAAVEEEQVPRVEAVVQAEADSRAQIAAEEGLGGGYLEVDEEDTNWEHMVAKLGGQQWWQCHLASVRQRMAAVFIHGMLYDVIIYFPKHQTQMKAHRLVLGMSSPVLERMLFGPLANFDGEGRQHITLNEDSPVVFEWLLRHIYRDETKFSGSHQALEVYRTAHKYQMEALVKSCTRYLSDVLDPECFAYVYQAALLHNDEVLLERCSQVAAMQGEEVLKSVDIVVLSRDSLRALLKLPRLFVERESIIFRALIQWGWFHLEEDLPAPYRLCPALLPVRRRLRAMIDEFFPFVRFLAMDLNEFLNEVESSGLLTARECMAIVRGIRSNVAPPFAMPRFVAWGATQRRRAQVWVVMLVAERPPSPFSHAYHERISIDLLQNFTVSHTVHMVRLIGMGVSSLKKGRVLVWSDIGEHMAGADWSGNSVVFKMPVPLSPGRQYRAILTVEAAWCALVDTVMNVVHRRIAFQGKTQCGGRIRLEYLPDDKMPLSDTSRRRAPVAYAVENPVD